MAKFDPRMISKEEASNLKKEILIRQQYLGSINFEYLTGGFDHRLYHLLFDGHSKSLYEQEGERPSIVMGRRGSGKSTYLNHLAQKQGILAIPIKTWDFIEHVENIVRLVIEKQGAMDAEKCADIWQLIFLVLVASKVSIFRDNNQNEVDFLSKIVGEPLTGGSSNVITGNLMKTLMRTYSCQQLNFDIELCIDELTKQSISLDSIERRFSETLRKSDKIVIFMLDNPELLHHERVQEFALRRSDKSRGTSWAGILNLLGRYNKGNSGIQIRLCVPVEQFSYLLDVSTAKKKDFDATQVLHWTSGEILSMAAHRYMVFLSVYEKYRSDTRYRQLLEIHIYEREGALRFWNEVLEPFIVNTRDKRERTLTYLLRHTQLVPRQLLNYLNRAIDIELGNNNGARKDLTRLSGASLYKAIHDMEFDLAAEVIDSYSYTYPEGNEIFASVLAKIPVITTAKEIKDYYFKNTEAKAIMNRYTHYPQVSATRERFLRMLIESGVYGRVKQRPKDYQEGYLKTEFEYTMPGSLRISDEETLAMHPIFSGNLGEHLYRRFGDHELGIYPEGTDMEEVLPGAG